MSGACHGGGYTPAHDAAVRKASDLFSLFLATRPESEAHAAAKVIKDMLLKGESGEHARTRGWISGVRGTVAASVTEQVPAPKAVDS